LKKIYEDDPLTHPDIDMNLWLEAGLSGRPHRNPVYKLPNTTDENLWMTRSISTVGCF